MPLLTMINPLGIITLLQFKYCLSEFLKHFIPFTIFTSRKIYIFLAYPAKLLIWLLTFYILLSVISPINEKYLRILSRFCSNVNFGKRVSAFSKSICGLMNSFNSSDSSKYGHLQTCFMNKFSKWPLSSMISLSVLF